jgi:hypothetical protein
METTMRIRAILCLTLLTMAASARPAHAGIFDLIWEMTGPRMFGFGALCEFGRGPTTRCYTNFPRFFESRTKWWLIVEPSLYLATGRGDWEAGSVLMVAVDPMVAVPWIEESGGKHHWYTAAGLSLNRFVGASVDDFSRVGFKVRPLTYEYHPGDTKLLKRVLISYTARYYRSNALTDRQTGQPVLYKGSGSEWVHGPTVAFLF